MTVSKTKTAPTASVNADGASEILHQFQESFKLIYIFCFSLFAYF